MTSKGVLGLIGKEMLCRRPAVTLDLVLRCHVSGPQPQQCTNLRSRIDNNLSLPFRNVETIVEEIQQLLANHQS